MNFLKRATASIVRRPGKSIILLLLIFILGTIISGALAVESAVSNTDAALRRGMRPLAMLIPDHERVQEWMDEEGLGNWDWNWLELTDEQRDIITGRVTAETAQAVGALPYVESYSYSIQTGLHDLPDFYPFSIWDMEFENTEWTHGQLFVLGTSNPVPVQVSEGVAQIVDGRGYFTEAEMNAASDVIPVIMFRNTVEFNNLRVGETFTLTQQQLFERNWNGPWEPDFGSNPANVFQSRDLTFELIGVFDIEFPEDFNPGRDWELANTFASLVEHMHMPNQYVMEIANFGNHFEMILYMYENDMIEEGHSLLMEWDGMSDLDRILQNPEQWDASEEPEWSVQAFYVLYDPADEEAFKEAAEEILPFNTTLHFRDGGFSAIESSMGTLQDIAFWVLVVAIGATLLILSLLITLFLRDRRYEMGVYLAIGEKKSRIVSQILLEVIVVALVSITLAVFTGNIISAQMSTNMIRNELTAPTNHNDPHTTTWSWDPLENFGLGTQEMSPDEMLAAFDASMSIQTIGIFYAIGLGAVIVSAIVPVFYVVTLNPKKVLM